MAGRRIILRGGTLLCLDGRRTIRRTDVLVDDGVIAAIGGVDAPGAEVVQVSGLVMPGLVQAHLQLDLSLQGPGFVAASDPAVRRRQDAAWRGGMDEHGARISAQAGLSAALSAGAITVADPSSVRFGPSALAAARAVGSRLVLFVDAAKKDAFEALVVAREGVAADGADPTVSLALWCGAAERTPRGRLRAAARLAAQEGVPLVVTLGAAPGLGRGLERLERAGALGPQTVLVHAHGATLATPRARARVKAAGAAVVVTPSHEILTGAPPAPVAELLAEAIPVGLGSVGGAARLGMDLFAEARLAARLLRGKVAAPASLALEMAARFGADGLKVPTGVLEVGRRADLIVLALEPDPQDDHEAVAAKVLDSGGPELLRALYVQGVPRLGEHGSRRAPAPDVVAEVRGRLVEATRPAAGRASWTEVVRAPLRQGRGWHRLPWG